MLIQLTLPESPDVIRIPLGHDTFALIDAGDYELVSRYRWHRIQNNTGYGYWYAEAYIGRFEGRGRTTTMHRLIMGAVRGQDVDHIDADGLNNRRFNLRVCTHGQNTMNRRKLMNAASPYRGVSIFSQSGKWRAQIRINRKHHSLGLFATQEEAAIAYNKAAVQYYGEFARLNVL